MKPTFDKNKLDVSAIYLMYIATVGDCDRVALAMDIAPDIIRALAESEGWLEKVKKISLLSKGETPGSWERAQNRAIAWVGAHMLRCTIHRLIETLGQMTREELFNTCVIVKAGSVQYSARLYADLSAALQKTNEIAFSALGDSQGERDIKPKEGDDMSIAAVCAAVTSALSNPVAAGIERKLMEGSVTDIIVNNIPKK